MNIENTIQTACGLEGKIVRNGTINCTATGPKELLYHLDRPVGRESEHSHTDLIKHIPAEYVRVQRESKFLEGLRRGRQTLVGKAIR